MPQISVVRSGRLATMLSATSSALPTLVATSNSGVDFLDEIRSLLWRFETTDENAELPIKSDGSSD